MPLLHLVIPFLDEEATLGTITDRVVACRWPEGWSVRIVLVDDGSGDTASRAAARLAAAHGFSLLRHPVNRGKGAALRTAFAHVVEHANDDDLVGVQDADLEYDPADLARMIETIEQAPARIDAAFGNRWAAGQPSTVRRIHRLGNRVLTMISNRLTGLGVSDMECCFKVIRIPMLRTLLPDLDEDRFAIEPQLAAALARHDARVTEVAVSYEPRSFAEGKKIGIADGFAAIGAMVREWGRTRRHRRRQHDRGRA